ncbi:MAG: hypothetical protein HKN78_10675 [Sphingomonadaceae bacterium]|nr:hypothetical protein [Sphingomonadaceae bacterium]
MTPVYVKSGVAIHKQQGGREWLYSPIGTSGANSDDPSRAGEILDTPVPAFLFKYPESAIIVANLDCEAPFAALADQPGWEQRARTLAPEALADAFAAVEGRIATGETKLRLQSIGEFEKSSLKFRAYRVDPFDGHYFEADDRQLSTQGYSALARQICFEPDAATE